MVPRVDIALGVLLAAGAAALAGAGEDGSALAAAFAAAVGLPVVWRRRAPLPSAAAFALAAVVSGIPSFDQVRCGAAIPAGLLVAFALGTRTAWEPALVGLLLVSVGMVILSLTDSVLEPAGVAFLIPLSAGVWGAGRFVRSRNRLAAELEARSRMLAEQREENAAIAVELERSRLGADLDATTRRRVTELIAASERGGQVVASDPGRVTVEFRHIERVARESLNEMRDVLGVLRSDEGAVRGPQPTLAQLDALLADARAGGRVVDLDVSGERRPLPAVVELAAYRILEHGLAATERDATISVRYLPGTVELEVAAAAGSPTRADAALTAARERARAHGGEFSIEALGGGRTRLRARLPALAHG